MRPKHKPGPVEELPPARLNQVALVNGAAIAMAVGAVAIAMCAVAIESPLLQGRVPIDRAEQAALCSKLDQLHATWDPSERARLLAAAPEQAEHLLRPLHRLLREARHPRLLEAIEFAAAADQPVLAPVLADLARSGPPPVRAAALGAADALEPWSQDDLTHFLEDGASDVQRAALAVIARRRQGPWPTVARLLGSEDADVRAAAAAAFPKIVGTEAEQALWEAVKLGRPVEAAAALRALAGSDSAEQREAAVEDQLRTPNVEVQQAALECLTARTEPLAQPDAVWSVVSDHALPMALRLQAMTCLERTGSADPARVRDMLPSAEPQLRYHLARCLLLAGASDGLEVMIALAETQDGGEATVAARRLLSWMTGLGPNAPSTALRDALASMDWAARAGSLPAAPPLGL